GTARHSTIDRGTPRPSERRRPPLRGTAVSPERPSPTRLAATLCTPAPRPMRTAAERNATKLPRPTAARALAPRTPTVAVSTRLRTFCEIIAPMIGRARLKIRRMRGVATTGARPVPRIVALARVPDGGKVARAHGLAPTRWSPDRMHGGDLGRGVLHRS